MKNGHPASIYNIKHVVATDGGFSFHYPNTLGENKKELKMEIPLEGSERVVALCCNGLKGSSVWKILSQVLEGLPPEGLEVLVGASPASQTQAAPLPSTTARTHSRNQGKSPFVSPFTVTHHSSLNKKYLFTPPPSGEK